MENDKYDAQKEKKRVEGWKEKSLQRSMYVKFMVDNLRKKGCGMHDKFITVENCEGQVGGGFLPHKGVVLCHNHLRSQADVDLALTHELIHAFDHCRAHVDWSNLDHHACSEVRAANLSGDCWWSNEIKRGNFRLRKQFQECVKRRAIISVAMNPNCKNEAQAKEAVEKVYETCMADTEPFDRAP